MEIEDERFLRAETAYVSDIPPDASEKIIERFKNGAKKFARYYFNRAMVGQRGFFDNGNIEDEVSFLKRKKHGRQYLFNENGNIWLVQPFDNGLPHGTAYYYADDGRCIGSYTMERGTGLWLFYQEWFDGKVDLTEAWYMLAGKHHGFDWWFEGRYGKVSLEQHWLNGSLHGIKREWSKQRRLGRSFPRFYVHNRAVTKKRYLAAAKSDETLPPYREEDDKPYREFPPEVAVHLVPRKI